MLICRLIHFEKERYDSVNNGPILATLVMNTELLNQI